MVLTRTMQHKPPAAGSLPVPALPPFSPPGAPFLNPIQAPQAPKKLPLANPAYESGPVDLESAGRFINFLKSRLGPDLGEEASRDPHHQAPPFMVMDGPEIKAIRVTVTTTTPATKAGSLQEREKEIVVRQLQPATDLMTLTLDANNNPKTLKRIAPVDSQPAQEATSLLAEWIQQWSDKEAGINTFQKAAEYIPRLQSEVKK